MIFLFLKPLSCHWTWFSGKATKLEVTSTENVEGADIEKSRFWFSEETKIFSHSGTRSSLSEGGGGGKTGSERGETNIWGLPALSLFITSLKKISLTILKKTDLTINVTRTTCTIQYKMEQKLCLLSARSFPAHVLVGPDKVDFPSDSKVWNYISKSALSDV